MDFCDNCGEKVFNGKCINCDEDYFIQLDFAEEIYELQSEEEGVKN